MKSTSPSTGKGDDGYTSLANGLRVSKGHPVIRAMGALDLLCAELGMLKAMFAERKHSDTCEYAAVPVLEELQNDVLAISGRFAGFETSREAWDTMANRVSQHLEHAGRLVTTPVGFSLPGRSVLSAQADRARAQCRCAEQAATALYHNEMDEGILQAREPGSIPLVFLNRLADYLYLLSMNV